MDYYYSPSTVDEAITTAGKLPGKYTFFAGGTDIQVYRKQQLDTNEFVIDLCSIEELNSINFNDGALRIGSMVTLDEIISSDEIHKHYPLISEAASTVATPVLRKTATIGGNLLVKNRCTFYNQSKEWRDGVGSCIRDVGEICQVTGGKDDCFSRNVSDTVTALIALGAEITLMTPDGTINKSLKDIYLPCGIKFHDLEEHSILTQISVPLEPKKWWYKKLRLRKTLDFTSLTVAAAVDINGIARVCLNGVSMSPILIEESIDSLTLENLVKQARKNCKTVDNDLLSLKYRREMINVFLKEWWNSVQSV